MSERDYLFSYRWNGAEYGMTVRASSLAEAKGRVAQMSLARYDGEIKAAIRLPGLSFFARLFGRNVP